MEYALQHVFGAKLHSWLASLTSGMRPVRRHQGDSSQEDVLTHHRPGLFREGLIVHEQCSSRRKLTLGQFIIEPFDVGQEGRVKGITFNSWIEKCFVCVCPHRDWQQCSVWTESFFICCNHVTWPFSLWPVYSAFFFLCSGGGKTRILFFTKVLVYTQTKGFASLHVALTHLLRGKPVVLIACDLWSLRESFSLGLVDGCQRRPSDCRSLGFCCVLTCTGCRCSCNAQVRSSHWAFEAISFQ